LEASHDPLHALEVCEHLLVPLLEVDELVLRIRSGEDHKNGVHLIGGTHPDELINPDLLLGLALKLCWAYANGNGLNFGVPTRLANSTTSTGSLAPPFPGKNWSATEIRQLVEGVDIFIAPNINPDRRTYVQPNYEVTQVVPARDSVRPPVIEKALATRIERLVARLERHASPQLSRSPHCDPQGLKSHCRQDRPRRAQAAALIGDIHGSEAT
jgi:hypothetical protein